MSQKKKGGKKRKSVGGPFDKASYSYLSGIVACFKSVVTPVNCVSLSKCICEVFQLGLDKFNLEEVKKIAQTVETGMLVLFQGLFLMHI